MSKSKIEWTDRSDWNPVRGCSRVSPGCGGPGPHGGCYAEAMAARFSLSAVEVEANWRADPKNEGKTPPIFNDQWGHGFAEMTGGKPRWTGKVELQEDRITLPLKWRKPAKIFALSTSDLFHENLSDADIDRVFAVMALCPQHTFQVLTKRAERMHRYMTEHVKGLWAGRVTRVDDDGVVHPEWDVAFRMRTAICELLPKAPGDALNRATAWLDKRYGEDGYDGFMPQWPLPNVWLGVSAERQREADERIALLLQTPAAVRFISAEPLLGPIDLNATPLTNPTALFPSGEPALCQLDWVIVGGESGSKARPMHPQWPRDLRDQCKAAGVSFFFKQWGEWAPIGIEENEDGDFDAAYPLAGCSHPDAHKHGQECLFWQGDELVHWPLIESKTAIGVRRVGKKAAGRLLDGVEHNEFPTEAS
jgi:protein gp37